MRTRTAFPLLSAGVLLLAVAVTHVSGLVHVDRLVVASVMHLHVMDPLVAASWAITAVAGTDVALPLAALFAVGLLALRIPCAAVGLAAAVGLTQLVVQVVKGIVERPRPAANASVAEAGGFSFPSGHSATSAALFGALALVAIRYTHGKARIAVASAAALMVVAVGVSRVMLGAHYPTDVLAGWLTGLALAAISLAVARRVRRRVADAL